jgi:hypothetical protein
LLGELLQLGCTSAVANLHSMQHACHTTIIG